MWIPAAVNSVARSDLAGWLRLPHFPPRCPCSPVIAGMSASRWIVSYWKCITVVHDRLLVLTITPICLAALADDPRCHSAEPRSLSNASGLAFYAISTSGLVPALLRSASPVEIAPAVTAR